MIILDKLMLESNSTEVISDEHSEELLRYQKSQKYEYIYIASFIKLRVDVVLVREVSEPGEYRGYRQTEDD